MEAMVVTGNTLNKAAWAEILKKQRLSIGILKNMLFFIKRPPFPFKKEIAPNFI